MSKTKIVSILTLIGCLSSIGVDIFDGGGFALKARATELVGITSSLGLYFLRDAIQKVLKAIDQK